MNRLLKVAGLVAGLIGGFLTGLWEIFLSPLYAGAVPLPVSPVLAVVTNGALIWFTRRLTGSAGLSLVPGLAWFATVLVGASTGPGGDVLVPEKNYMGLATILLGGITWAVMAYRQVLNRPLTAGGVGGPRTGAARPGGARTAGTRTLGPAKPGPAKPGPAKPGPAKPARQPGPAEPDPTKATSTKPGPAAKAGQSAEPGPAESATAGASGQAGAGRASGSRPKSRRSSGPPKSSRPGGRR